MMDSRRTETFPLHREGTNVILTKCIVSHDERTQTFRTAVAFLVRGPRGVLGRRSADVFYTHTKKEMRVKLHSQMTQAKRYKEIQGRTYNL